MLSLVRVSTMVLNRTFGRQAIGSLILKNNNKMNTVSATYKCILAEVEEHIGHTHRTNTTELESAGMFFLPMKFRGVFPANQIPILTLEQPYCIVNLDSSDQVGRHWVSIAKHKGGVHFYDSYGRDGGSILPLLILSGNGYITNADNDVEQSLHESNCGQRSLSWLLLYERYGAKLALEL